MPLIPFVGSIHVWKQRGWMWKDSQYQGVGIFQVVGHGTKPSYLAHFGANPSLIMVHVIQMSQPVETLLFQDHSVVNDKESWHREKNMVFEVT